jgi:hypothetical protein
VDGCTIQYPLGKETHMKAIHTTAVIIAAASTVASADIVDMKFTGTGAGQNVRIQIGDNDAFNVFAGELKHEITNAAGVDQYLNGTHRTFCADVNEHVTRDFAQYHTEQLENIPLTASNSAPMSSTQANAIRSLYSQNNATLMSGVLSNAYGAAMQITLWEIVNDFDGTADSINVNAGNLTFASTNSNALDAGVLAQIESFKAQITSGLNLGQTGPDKVLGLANEGAQDQLVAVPTPGSLSLLASAGLIAVRRRRSA